MREYEENTKSEVMESFLPLYPIRKPSQKIRKEGFEIRKMVVNLNVSLINDMNVNTIMIHYFAKHCPNSLCKLGIVPLPVA